MWSKNKMTIKIRKKIKSQIMSKIKISEGVPALHLALNLNAAEPQLWSAVV
jgi:intein-encoded DNA endonuclease-like protein